MAAFLKIGPHTKGKGLLKLRFNCKKLGVAAVIKCWDFAQWEDISIDKGRQNRDSFHKVLYHEGCAFSVRLVARKPFVDLEPHDQHMLSGIKTVTFILLQLANRYCGIDSSPTKV